MTAAIRTPLLLVMALIVAVAGGCTKPAEKPVAEAAKSPTPAVATSAAKPAETPAAIQRVLGRWIREDGGYILEIRGGAAGGILEAAYLNPRPIHVSRAAWYEGGGRLQVLVELNDVGYPGATYVLKYDAQTDRLAGQYTQPSLQQSFEIEFARENKR